MCRLTYVTSSLAPGQTAEQQIAHLHAQLAVAHRRADVAEQQLRRVHAAVRDFKQRQLAAKQAEAAIAQAKMATQTSTGLFQAWPAADPSLDDRFQDFLNGEDGDDAARKWMLDED